MANRFTKTTRAQQEILNLIAREQLARGDRLPPEKELEKAIGVSIITVRRALAELAGRGLIERVQGKGTFLKQAINSADSLGTVAFLLVDRPTSPYEHTLEDARSAARRRGSVIKLVTTGPQPDAAASAELQGVTGVVITGYVTDDWMAYLEMMDLPTVVMGIHKLARPGWTVQHDFAGAMALLVDRLVAAGCRRIGFINADKRYLPAHHMHQGFMTSLARHDLPHAEADVVWCRHDDRLASLSEFFAQVDRPYDALVVESGCLRALLMFMYEHEEIRGRPVLGLLGEHLDKPRGLSCFEMVGFQQTIGEAAIDLLFEAMSSEDDQHRVVLLPPAQDDPTQVPD